MLRLRQTRLIYACLKRLEKRDPQLASRENASTLASRPQLVRVEGPCWCKRRRDADSPDDAHLKPEARKVDWSLDRRKKAMPHSYKDDGALTDLPVDRIVGIWHSWFS